jgi:RNA polymerase sigma factor (sigma-70 family)
MDGYAYLLEQLRRDDFRRLRGYVDDAATKFTTWLVVVARRMYLDYLRSRYGRPPGAGAPGNRARALRRQLVDLLVEELDASGRSDPAAADDPESRLRASELTRALTGALAALEPRDRLLLGLRFDEALPAREIARVMGFPTPFHVYRRLNALLASLRAALQRGGVEGPEP